MGKGGVSRKICWVRTNENRIEWIDSALEGKENEEKVKAEMPTEGKERLRGKNWEWSRMMIRKKKKAIGEGPATGSLTLLLLLLLLYYYYIIV